MNHRSLELEIDGAVNRARLRGEGTEALSAARVFVLAYAESLTWGLERISHALNVRGRGETVDVVFRLREGEVGCVVVEYRLTVCGVVMDERVLAHDPGGLSGVEHRAARCASHDLDLVARCAGVADVFPGPELSDLDPGAEGVEVACPAGPECRLRDGFGSLEGCVEELRKGRAGKSLDECCRVLQEELVPWVNKYSRELEDGKRGALRLDVRLTQKGKWPERDGDEVEDVVNLLLYEKAAAKKGKESMIWTKWFGEEVLKEKGGGIVEYLKGRIDAFIFERYSGVRIG